MVLLTMTIFSTALAATTSVMAWQLSRREARRSEARVATLAAAIHGPRGAVNDDVSDAIAGFPSEHAAVVTTERVGWKQSGHRMMTIASLGTLVVAGVLMLAVTKPRDSDTFQDGGAAATWNASAGRSIPPTTASAATPLELMALSHERGTEGLIVRGAIRNPSNGTVCDVPAVVVLTFDARGVFLGSSESAANGETLPPGARASFSVTIPGAAATPARYTVSFRSAGRVVPHVDRRAPDADSDRPAGATKARPPRQVQS